MADNTDIPILDHSLLRNFGISWEGIGYSVIPGNDAPRPQLDRPYRSSFFMVLIVDHGEGRLRVNLAERRVQKGNLLVVMPQSVIEPGNSSPDMELSGLVADVNFLSRLGLHTSGSEAFEFFAAPAGVLLELPEEEVSILKCMLQILRHQATKMSSSLLRQDIARHTFLSFMYELAALYRTYNREIPSKMNRKEELTFRFFNLLSAHFREERSVQFYADELCVTAKYLSEAIKEVTTKTAGELIDEAVIVEAKILLSNPLVNVAQIAEQLHFSNQSFFGKYFKKHTGFSPSEFRVRYRDLS